MSEKNSDYEEKRKAVSELVSEAMVKQDTATYFGEGCSSEMTDLCARTTAYILNIFGLEEFK